MSDLDDLFSKRLDEEAQFPRRDKNWNAMSKRLDAWQTGLESNDVGGGGSGNTGGVTSAPAQLIRWWQIATAVATTVAAVAIWQVATLNQQKENLTLENVTLKEQLSNTKRSSALPETRVESSENIASTTTSVQQTSDNTPAQPSDKSTTTNSNAIQSTIDQHKADAIGQPAVQAPAAISSNAPAPIGSAPAAVTTSAINVTQNAANQQTGTGIAAKPAATTTSVEPSANTALQQPIQTSGKEVAAPQSDAVAPVASTPQQMPAVVASPDSSVAKAATQQPLQPLDSLASAPVQRPAAKDTVKTAPKPAPDTIARAAAPAQETKILRTHQPRISIGVAGIAGRVLPQIDGISTVYGQGIQLAVRPWSTLWVSAQMDGLRFDEKTKTFEPSIHPCHDTFPSRPGGPWHGGHEYDLVGVESQQRQTRLGLGLKYVIPTPTQIRPFIQVHHEWVRFAAHNVLYKFEERDHGGPGPGPNPEIEFANQDVASHWERNFWKFGSGLTYTSGKLAVTATAEYSSQLGSGKPVYDLFQGKLGVQYQF